jgi:hypothetical protein
MNECEWCGTGFTSSRPTTKTCSAECRDQRRLQRARDYAASKYVAAEPKPNIPCAHCGEAFTPYRESSKFCSRQCQWNYKTIASRPRTRPCIHCGTDTPTRPGKPVCDDCRADKRDPLRAKARERRRTLKAYGITQQQYDTMLAEQQGRCAVCARNNPGHTQHWAVDHCHKTGVVRGLLCSPCNMGIGQLGDNPDTLESAAQYLRRAA